MRPIRKDKPKAKTTMLDFIKENQNFIKENQSSNPLEKQTMIAQSNVHAFKYTDEYMEQVQKYNQGLTTLDPKYTSVKPLHEILVRFYLHEPTVVGGLVMPFKEFVPVPTKSGVGSSTELETDFPFADKAVIVSAPDSNPLKPGDIVKTSRKATQLLVLGTGANALIKIEQSFVHPDSMLHYPPTDISNQHYGYALIQYHLIQAKL